MRKVAAFVIKFIMTLAVLWIILGLFFGISFRNIVIMSIILTIASFLVDMFILPKVGNIVAAVGDFALAYFGIWLISSFLFTENIAVKPITTGAFLSAIVILVGELFYHRYLRNSVFNHVDDDDQHYTNRNILQHEFSKEFDED